MITVIAVGAKKRAHYGGISDDGDCGDLRALCTAEENSMTSTSKLRCLIFIFLISMSALSPVMAEEPVIYFTYLFNWNINHAGAPVSGMSVLVEQGHIPLLDIFEKHDRWTAQFFISAYTSEYLESNYPQTLDRIKKGVKSGNYEIGTYTLSHPILNLTPYNNLVLQLNKGLEYDVRIWGFTPKSLFLPENAWDVTLPQVFTEVGLEWIAIYKDIVPEFAEELYYPPAVFVQGINNSQIPAVFCAHYLTRSSVEELKATLEALHALLKSKGIREHFLAFKGDAEDIYFGSLSILNATGTSTYQPGEVLPELPASVEWDQRLAMVENLPFAQFMTMGEWLSAHVPERTLANEEISTSADFTPWLRGNGVERINILTDEARMEVSNATYAIMLAQKLGLDVGAALQLLDQAHYQLMLSEGADGRATNPPASRKVFVMEAAVNATTLSRKAVEAIKNK